MDYGASSSSVAEKVSLAPVYSVFMEAPDARGIVSPPTVGHLLLWPHLHPEVSGEAFLNVYMCKCRRSWSTVVVAIVGLWSSVSVFGLNHLSAIIRQRWSESYVRVESRRMEENRAQNVLTKTSRCSLHPSACTLPQAHDQGSPAICWPLIELHPCFHLKWTNSETPHQTCVLILSEPKFSLTSSPRLPTGNHWF